jgi:IS1 family transposase
MNIPTSKKETLDRMYQIVRQDSWDSRDVQPIRDLIDLANHSEIREGMGKRRRLLEDHLRTLARLNQQAAIDRHWSEIHSLVSDFAAEIACATSSGSSHGGSGYQ